MTRAPTGPGRLAGRAALVTGAGSGIGRAAAVLFAAEGAAVAVLDLRLAAAEETVEEITAGGGRAVAIRADVADAADADRAVTEAVGAFGRLDVLYNNAGVDGRGTVADAAEEVWDRCLSVNAKGTFLMSRAAVPRLRAAGGAAIVNQGSVAALVGIRDFAPYCAAKGAIVALTRSMALDLAPLRIRVNVICPGTVLTPLMEPMLRERGGGDLQAGLALTVAKYPIGRLGSPAEIARVALFLAGEESSFLTGAVIAADGGMTAQ
jgi:NAD(P)-dependent dehydrogenase (short-subunit alcohol dehydrogenase family)